MKKRYRVIAVMIAALLPSTSCAKGVEGVFLEMAYQDPQTIGGKWDEYFDNGDYYKGAECTYWGTEDDTTVWLLQDGIMMIQSGAVHAV